MLDREIPCPCIEETQRQFLLILPRIQLHGNIYFRNLPPVKREEAVAEMVALSWGWFRSLIERGKDPLRFAATFVTFAARAVKCGRRVGGMEKTKDVLSPLAQQRHGFRVERLPSSTSQSFEKVHADFAGQHLMDAYEERLHDNTLTPIPDQVQFRLDWPAWLATRTERDRRIIDDMAMNEKTQILARKFGLSPSRISQLRREYHDDWTLFTDGLGESDSSDTPIRA